jgi:hypothetical protein
LKCAGEVKLSAILFRVIYGRLYIGNADIFNKFVFFTLGDSFLLLWNANFVFGL